MSTFNVWGSVSQRSKTYIPTDRSFWRTSVQPFHSVPMSLFTVCWYFNAYGNGLEPIVLEGNMRSRSGAGSQTLDHGFRFLSDKQPLHLLYSEQVEHFMEGKTIKIKPLTCLNETSRSWLHKEQICIRKCCQEMFQGATQCCWHQLTIRM